MCLEDGFCCFCFIVIWFRLLNVVHYSSTMIPEHLARGAKDMLIIGPSIQLFLILTQWHCVKYKLTQTEASQVRDER